MSEFQEILEQLLKGGRLNHPYMAETPHSTYRNNLYEKLTGYILSIKGLTTSGPLTNWLNTHVGQIEKINYKLLDSIDQYLSGSAGKAYDKIEELMDLEIVATNLVNLKESLQKYSTEIFHNSSLFRVRDSEVELSNREDMFHIPFEKRNLVKTQRYSIAGLPCLYLGSSLYVCWQEMGKPSLNKLYLSHYQVNGALDNLYVLNFSFLLETLQHQNLEKFSTSDVSDKKAKAYLAIWPILQACSYNAEHPNSSFCIEYVIPNLILQWISKEKRPVSGIMYLSTKTNHLRNYDIGINFVFPPNTIDALQSKYCSKLNNIFVWSKPVAWQLLNTFEYNDIRSNDYNSPMSQTDDIEKELIKNYENTKFYAMEEKLRALTKLNNLKNNV